MTIIPKKKAGIKIMQHKSVCIILYKDQYQDSRYYNKFAKALKCYGCDVTILCHDFEGIDENGIKFVKNDEMFFENRMNHIAKVIYENAAKINADIYIITDYNLLKIGKKLSKNKKVIYDVNETKVEDILKDTKHTKLYKTLKYKIKRFFYQKN